MYDEGGGLGVSLSSKTKKTIGKGLMYATLTFLMLVAKGVESLFFGAILIYTAYVLLSAVVDFMIGRYGRLVFGGLKLFVLVMIISARMNKGYFFFDAEMEGKGSSSSVLDIPGGELVEGAIGIIVKPVKDGLDKVEAVKENIEETVEAFKEGSRATLLGGAVGGIGFSIVALVEGASILAILGTGMGGAVVVGGATLLEYLYSEQEKIDIRRYSKSWQVMRDTILHKSCTTRAYQEISKKQKQEYIGRVKLFLEREFTLKIYVGMAKEYCEKYKKVHKDTDKVDDKYIGVVFVKEKKAIEEYILRKIGKNIKNTLGIVI